MHTAAITEETTATTYWNATSYSSGEEYGIDLLTSDVERDSDGVELARQAASWSWHGIPAPKSWTAAHADQLLADKGWLRTGHGSTRATSPDSPAPPLR